MNEDEFVTALIENFPALRADVEEWAGFVFMQMAVFAQFTQDAINAGDGALLRRIFDFADCCCMGAERLLDNAFYVSYLEHLDLRGTRGAYARGLMSDALREAWDEMDAYMRRLAEQAEHHSGRS